jgi:DDE domain
MRKLLRKQGFAPTRVTTDKLRSYGAAFRHLGLSCHHEQGLRENNRAENSHQVVQRARAQDATLQISGIGATLSERACRRPQYLQPPAPSRLPVDASDLPIRSDGAMA